LAGFASKYRSKINDLRANSLQKITGKFSNGTGILINVTGKMQGNPVRAVNEAIGKRIIAAMDKKPVRKKRQTK